MNILCELKTERALNKFFNMKFDRKIHEKGNNKNFTSHQILKRKTSLKVDNPVESLVDVISLRRK